MLSSIYIDKFGFSFKYEDITYRIHLGERHKNHNRKEWTICITIVKPGPKMIQMDFTLKEFRQLIIRAKNDAN